MNKYIKRKGGFPLHVALSIIMTGLIIPMMKVVDNEISGAPSINNPNYTSTLRDERKNVDISRAIIDGSIILQLFFFFFKW